MTQEPASEPAAGWYPQERLTLEETIYAYTMGPAALSGKAHLQGSITPGKWADCILLADNLFEIPPAAIPQTQVAMTIVGGEVVYE